MNTVRLAEWLSQPRTALTDAVLQGIRNHVSTIQSRGIDFYGYALLPGESYAITDLVAVFNCEADIKVLPGDPQYAYYRYSVDEWRHWEPGLFDLAKDVLSEANTRFASMHVREGKGFQMDDFEIAHSDASLEAILRGLEAAKVEGLFGAKQLFLAMWISDSGHAIIAESVRRLNSTKVTRQFMAEFG